MILKNLKDQFDFDYFSSYLQIPIENYPNTPTYRKPIYAIEGVLICTFAYLWLEYTQMDGIFKSIYPVIVTAIVLISQYLLVEFGGRLIYKHWRPFETNIGIFWGISFVGIFFGYTMVYFNAQCPGIESFYPDIFYFFTEHPNPPNRLSVFYKIILIPWLISTFLITQIELKKQIDKELSYIKSINNRLGLEKKESKTDSKDKKKSEYFEVTIDDSLKKIAYEDLYYISIKDHYCELAINKEGELAKQFVRLSLKEAIKDLPKKYFEQVHRSHVVNLQHVKKIKRKGQTYQLQLSGTNVFIPASRHRARIFLPKLKKVAG